MVMPKHYLSKFFNCIFLIIFLSACSETEVVSEIVTTRIEVRQVELEGTAYVVTRVIEEISTVVPTPNPDIDLGEDAPVEIDISYLGSLPNLDPQQATGAAGLDLMENIFVGLTNYNLVTNQIEPELAESWEMSANGRVWTFHLREDISWVGQLPNAASAPAPEVVRAVTADDVVYALKRACGRDVPTPDTFVLFIIAGCEQLSGILDVADTDDVEFGAIALDGATVQITLNQAASYFLTLTSTNFFKPVPQELVEEFGFDWIDNNGNRSTGWQTPRNLVVSGPFVPLLIDESTEKLTLFVNPLWSGRDEGETAVDIINIQFFEDDQDIFTEWDAKKLDIGTAPANELDDLLERTPQKAQFVPDPTVFYYGFNFESGVFREPEVRRAFNAAIDRERLIEEMLGGEGVPLRQFTPPGIVGSAFLESVGKGYDPDYARLQMALSGFRDCRLMPPFTILVSASDRSLRQAELMRDMWVEELSCDESLIVIEQADFGVLLKNTQADAGVNRPDMWELAWAPFYADAHNFLFDVLHCSESENRQKRPCGQADQLLIEARLTNNAADRQRLYREVEKIFFSENGSLPVIPLYLRGDYVLIQTWVGALAPPMFGGIQYGDFRINANLKKLEQSR